MHPLIESTAQRIEDAVNQLADMDRLAASEKDDEPQAATDAAPSSDESPRGEDYFALRALWNANCRRLDGVRSRVKNKRKRDKLMALPRTGYKTIIDRLFDEGLITEAVRNGSLNLHATYMAHRRKDPGAKVVADMTVLDSKLEHEFDNIEKAQADRAVSKPVEPVD